MRSVRQISNKEFMALLMLASILLVSVLWKFSLKLVTDYNDSVRSEQDVLQWRANGQRVPLGAIDFDSPLIAVDFVPMTVPLYHVLAVFVFMGIIKAKRFIFALTTTAFYLAIHLFALDQRHKYWVFWAENSPLRHLFRNPFINTLMHLIFSSPFFC